jgi:cation:H+ antiporter
MNYLLFALAIIGGIIGLVWSADKFVLGASTTARNLGVSILVIGLTVVSFGTSAPEIFTSTTAALRSANELAIGNVIGSNIANIGLVLSITLLICPIVIPSTLLKEELPALLLVTLAAVFIFQDLSIKREDGIILLLLLALFTWFILKRKGALSKSHLSESEEIADYIADISTSKALALMLMGLVVLLLSANILVYGATGIARELGVSELIIGLTIVAIGTSLPELAASAMGALRGHHDLAVGNVIGSNILNLLLVLPVPAFLAPLTIEPVVFWRDTLSMLGITLLLACIIAFKIYQRQKLGRGMGIVLLALYLSYTALVIVMS